MLTTLLSATALTVSAVLSVPVAVFSAECLAGTVFRRKPVAVPVDKRPQIAILVPAHNEEGGISKTLHSIKAEMLAGDRLIVVADNCTDRTAEFAEIAGAEVVVRNNDSQRGKGFALHAGMLHLAQSPPEIVVIVDADCILKVGALDRLSRMAEATNGPVQGCYLMTSPSDGRLDQAVREFAFVVKNRVRPLGLSRLGLPCQLTGSGMAFPWSALNAAELSNDNLVEDMKLGLDLARLGHAPSFCADALVLSEFPQSRAGSITQNRRWESGHLSMIKTALGILTERGTLRRPGLIAMALDIMVPPLALLVLLLGAVFVFSSLLLLAGVGTLAFAVSLINLLLVTVGIAAAWFAYGTKLLPLGKLYRIPLYAIRKVAFYAKIFRGNAGAGWIRTDRGRGD